ncbi:type II toxin-antitoxin system VapC family toxin [Geodermatophilus sabuli]|uniref:PIN domain nuclease, a component of toxin-antitoxin system (PIN domain) n=1 Tax=Geodermatophilus sabuli TaxID=1564158 RepID=A0A285ECQ3_9ACTN|nr:type II toxin-antitoxin system VapC family toxin [Geodermatophilus sabuli]MBB3085586.1 PIN domain nuclease of toxin-antitoxin system [Geodermatophilus sabuli]SNX95994.1 PIN domain nuclease, a component of toxin-antitoxin system (PIN domain) [Geodermatophilus sabuli]
MRVLLDTHVLVWAAATPERLGAAEELLADADLRMASAASIWELAIKQRLGKLSLGSDVRTWSRRVARELVLDHLPVTADHAAAVEHLPDVHRDPFDRLLVAQAVAEDAVLLTADARLTGYGDVVRFIGGPPTA